MDNLPQSVVKNTDKNSVGKEKQKQSRETKITLRILFPTKDKDIGLFLNHSYHTSIRAS